MNLAETNILSYSFRYYITLFFFSCYEKYLMPLEFILYLGLSSHTVYLYFNQIHSYEKYIKLNLFLKIQLKEIY